MKPAMSFAKLVVVLENHLSPCNELHFNFNGNNTNYFTIILWKVNCHSLEIIHCLNRK